MTRQGLSRSMVLAIFCFCCFLLQLAQGFVVIQPTATRYAAIMTKTALPSTPLTLAEASVSTVDPTSFLSNVLGGILGSPVILAIPIVAAVGVASLVAFAIVAYASPAAQDDE